MSRAGFKVLIVGADAAGFPRLRFQDEARVISDRVDANCLLNATFSTLNSKLISFKPDIVHFICHGDKGVLHFFAPQGSARVDSDGLARALTAQGRGYSLTGVVFNACNSEGLARAVGASLEFAVGMSGKMPDPAGALYSSGFYGGVENGLSWRECHKMGVESIQSSSRFKVYKDRPRLEEGPRRKIAAPGAKPESVQSRNELEYKKGQQALGRRLVLALFAMGGLGVASYFLRGRPPASIGVILTRLKITSLSCLYRLMDDPGGVVSGVKLAVVECPRLKILKGLISSKGLVQGELVRGAEFLLARSRGEAPGGIEAKRMSGESVSIGSMSPDFYYVILDSIRFSSDYSGDDVDFRVEEVFMMSDGVRRAIPAPRTAALSKVSGCGGAYLGYPPEEE